MCFMAFLDIPNYKRAGGRIICGVSKHVAVRSCFFPSSIYAAGKSGAFDGGAQTSGT